MRWKFRAAALAILLCGLVGCSSDSNADAGGSKVKVDVAPAAQTTDDDVQPDDAKRGDVDLLEIDTTTFDRSTTIDNEWWPLKPGSQHVYAGTTVEDGEEIPHSVVETVTDLTKVINDVRVVVCLEEDYSAGELVEAELAFHAQDNDGNVWHLGQLREEYEEKHFIGAQSWLSGHLEGAKAGIRMMKNPQVGASYSQGFAPPPFYWTDCSRVDQMGVKTTVPAGSFDDVMVIEEWDQESPTGVFQTKYYARGVGVIKVGFKGPDPEKEELELVKTVQLSPEELAEARARALKIEERAYVYGHTPAAELSVPSAEGK